MIMELMMKLGTGNELDELGESAACVLGACE